MNAAGKCVKPKDCPKKVCSDDEVFNDCGSACPATCENYGQPIICTDQCVRGCFCKGGMVRNKDGRCVYPERCPKTICNDDEMFQSCGSSCPDTCDNYGKPRICTLQCVSGCFCKRGLVRKSDFKCVIPERCEKKMCNEDEIYKTCGTACPETCDNLGQPRPCPKICVAGCFCKDGLVRNADTMKCILPEQCEKKCPQDQEYYPCKPTCKHTCETYNSTTEICSKICIPGCFCKQGLVMCSEGKCVEPKDCPKEPIKCGENEQHFDCMPLCNGYCEDNDNKMGCKMTCMPGCFCKNGFLKRKDGKCVLPKDCSECGPDETYYVCKPDCRNRCRPHDVCPPICNSGCYCKESLVLREDGKCVKREQCPPPEVEKCKREDEQFYDCIPDCKNTCEAVGKPNVACPKICRRGCFCKEGLVKRKDGKCVKPNECPDDESEGCGEEESEGEPEEESEGGWREEEIEKYKSKYPVWR